MLFRLIDVKLKLCDPGAKFFFIAFWRCYGAATPEPCSLKKLAEGLRLPAQAVSKAVAQLVDAAILRVVTQPEGRGRPRCTYEMSKAVQSDLGDIEERALNHSVLVEHLLSGERIRAIWPGWKGDAQPVRGSGARSRGEKRVAPGRVGQLSLANRLLLMILLSRADPFGVVRDLSSKELCLLTGMDGAALKQRLRRLTALGFIRRHIPGVASPVFAAKLKSIYLLNLNHLQLSPGGDVICTAVHQTFDDSGIDCRFVTSVRVDRDSFVKRAGYQTKVSVLRLLRLAPDHAFDQLEFFICECASDFLSRHRGLVDLGPWEGLRGIDSALKDRVATFFRIPMFDPKDKAVLDHGEVIEFFQGLIFELADEYARRFSQLSQVSFANVSFILVPTHISIGHRSIALLIKRPPGCGQADHWTVIKGCGEPVVTHVLRETDISLELRDKSGLLTSPRGAA